MLEENQTPRLGMSCSAILCVAFGLIASQASHENNAVALHSEWTLEDDPDVYFSQDNLSDEPVFWLADEVRRLKRGGSRSRRSTGNCYGDRCDNIGGDAESAAIVGVVFGTCCIFVCIYLLYKYIQEKREEKSKEAKKKKKKNRGEPIVVFPNGEIDPRIYRADPDPSDADIMGMEMTNIPYAQQTPYEGTGKKSRFIT